MNRDGHDDMPNTRHDILDDDILGELAAAGTRVEDADGAVAAARSKVMQAIADDGTTTIRDDRGAGWVELLPGVHKKLLHADPETGTETYLLRGEPGARVPPHPHPHDEHCIVLSGEVIYGQHLRLCAGDYHFAPRGSAHPVATTDTGVTVYIQTS